MGKAQSTVWHLKSQLVSTIPRQPTEWKMGRKEKKKTLKAKTYYAVSVVRGDVSTCRGAERSNHSQ